MVLERASARSKLCRLSRWQRDDPGCHRKSEAGCQNWPGGERRKIVLRISLPCSCRTCTTRCTQSTRSGLARRLSVHRCRNALMPTLNEITEGHSKRITRITQTRDDRLREAVDTRDRHLRALPAAARLYEAFDEQIAGARGNQAATDAKAEAARAAAHQEVGDTLVERARRRASCSARRGRGRIREATEGRRRRRARIHPRDRRVGAQRRRRPRLRKLARRNSRRRRRNSTRR